MILINAIATIVTIAILLALSVAKGYIAILLE